MLFDSKLRQTKSPLKTGGSFELCFLLLGKQTPFSWGRTGSKESSLAIKSIAIFKAKMHIYSWLLEALGAFGTAVTNPVLPCWKNLCVLPGETLLNSI